jgi:peroxiredoxin
VKIIPSKYQTNAKKNIAKKTSKSSPKYYDETISNKKGRSGSAPYAIFIFFILIIAGGIFGVGSLLDQKGQEGDSNLNTNYITFTSTTTTETVSTSYKTPITLNTIEGESISLADHEGKVVILYFHFLDCSACAYHSPFLSSVQAQYSASELIIFAITVDNNDSPEDLREWASDEGYNFKLVRDTDFTLASQFGAQATPRTIYIAPDGDSSLRETGAESEAAIMAKIDSLL